jgi:signal transduction histidine kinase
MAALALYLIFATVLCGFLAVIFFLREERLRKQLHERDRAQRHKYYEMAILKEIQDRVGYSLDLEKVVEVIQTSLKYFLSYSTTSALIIKDDRVVFITNADEPINPLYLEEVKNSMFASLTTITDRPLPLTLDHVVTGITAQQDQSVRPESSFHIPLFIQNHVVALINVSSVKPNLYKEAEITALTQIANQASKALTKLQEVLAIEKGKLMAMIGSLVDGVFMLDTSGHLLIINEAAKSYLKIKKTQPSLNDVFAAFSDTIDIQGKINESIIDNRLVAVKELDLFGRTMQLFITPVLKPTQTGVYYTRDQEKYGIIGASVLLHDITLEKSVAKMKEDFTNMMVHELRAPLTAMKDSAHLMLTMDNLEPDETKKLLAIIHSQSARLLEDVTSLLDAAKLEAGRFTIQKTPSDIRNVITERVQFFTPQAQSKHISLTAQIDEHLPVASFDPLRISQVLNNLLSNSLKYTPENGKILVKVSANAACISVLVADTGSGIPKAKQGVLFSKFGQIMNSVGLGTTHLSGTGLGLFITKGIIEAHDGKISLASEEGKGTTVMFTLPIQLENATAVNLPAEKKEARHPVHPPITDSGPADQPVQVVMPLPRASNAVN